MKKIVEIDDDLYEQLEKIRKDNHIKTISPVISLILTLGVKWFEKLNDISPTMNVPTPIPWPIPYQPYQPYVPWEPIWVWPNTTTDSPYPWEQYKVWCGGDGYTITGNADYTIGDWHISSYTSGVNLYYDGQ